MGVSALLTTTMMSQRRVIEALDKTGLRGRVKVLVGGAPVTREWALEKARALLRDHRPAPLDKALQTELRRIIISCEQAAPAPA